MKHLRFFVTAGALSLVLATSAFAGEIPMDIAKQSPSRSQATVMGDMPLPGITSINPVTEIALALMQSALLLF
ncbi:MAG TPA: hypothetical protein VE842_18915 [Pyrinomonadaceae bacterium]|nr:hypothetical protein [Pyrinomonadaceae bacterium]